MYPRYISFTYHVSLASSVFHNNNLYKLVNSRTQGVQTVLLILMVLQRKRSGLKFVTTETYIWIDQTQSFSFHYQWTLQTVYMMSSFVCFSFMYVHRETSPNLVYKSSSPCDLKKHVCVCMWYVIMLQDHRCLERPILGVENVFVSIVKILIPSPPTPLTLCRTGRQCVEEVVKLSKLHRTRVCPGHRGRGHRSWLSWSMMQWK